MPKVSALKILQIDASIVKKDLDENKKVILLDVRTEGEYAKAKIGGSINLPLNQVAKKITKTIPDKDALIYIYCLSGSRSEVAFQIMKKLGYSKIYSMSHGLLAWRAKGYKVSD